MKLRVGPALTTLVSGRPGMLARWLRVKNESARFSLLYQNFLWDGYERFFDMETRKFPTGLLRFVKRKCKRRGIPLTLKYDYKVPKTMPVNEDTLNEITLRDYQVEAANTCLEKARGCISSVTGSGKTACIAAVTGTLFLHHGVRSLILVPRKGLLVQTHEELCRFLGDGVTVGMVGGGYRSTNADIVVATPQTLRFALPEKMDFIEGKRHLIRKHEPKLLNLLRSCECLIVDECQHSSGETIYDLGLASPAKWRFGFSGTPLKKKKAEDLKMYALFDKVIYDVQAKELIDAGILAKPQIYIIQDDSIFSKRTAARHDYNTALRESIIRDRRYNSAISYIAKYLLKAGRPPIIFAPRVQHLKEIIKACERRDVPYEFLIGSHSLAHRKDVKERYKDGEEFALIVSSLFDEGEDVPNASSLIMAGGGKTHVLLKQRLGRGMRRKEGDNRVFVFDFVHSCSSMLEKHSDARKRTYGREGYHVEILDSIKEVKNVLRKENT